MASITIHRVDKSSRSGSTNGYVFTGWEYEVGWLALFSPSGGHPEKAIWVDSPTTFYAVPRAIITGQEVIEISPEPIELTEEEKDAIISMIWDWEIGEALARDGTCMIQSLAKALDLTDEHIVNMFRRAFRDPSIQEHVIQTLEENGYKVSKYGSEGFRYRERRRLVTMIQTDDPRSGHVVLVYENDEGIFDSSGVFKKVSDLITAPMRGFKFGDVLLIDKVEPGK